MSIKTAFQSISRLRRNGYSGPFFNGLMLFACGVQMLLPGTTFATSQSYDVMSEWATELGWGVMMIFCSLFIIIFSVRRKPEFVAMGALVAAFAWLVITVSVGLGNPQGLLFPLVAILTVRNLEMYREFMEHSNNPHYTGTWAELDEREG